MTVSEMFDPSALDVWSQPRGYVVKPESISAYAAATNDLAPEAVLGDVAPPVFAIVPAFGGGARSVIVEAHRAELAGRLVHGEQWMVLHRPIRGGDELEVRAATVGIHAKSSGVTVVSKSQTTSGDGLVNEQYVTIFYRGAHSDLDVGEVAPTLKGVAGDDPGTLVASITYPVDADQPSRYADAAGDHNRIHLDDTFARSVGLPGVIVHGMCTLAFACRAVRAALSDPRPDAVTQLGARFTRPLLPGDELTTRVYALGSEGRAVRFECVDGAGHTVLGAGYAGRRPTA